MIELKFVKGLFIFGTLYDLDDCIPFSPAWDLLWLGSLSGFSCEIPSINAAFSQDCSIGSDHHLKSNDFEHLLLLLWPITSYRRLRKFLKFWSYFVKSRGSDINRFEQMITSSWREFLVFQCSQLTVWKFNSATQILINSYNTGFLNHSDFTWNQLLKI